MKNKLDYSIVIIIAFVVFILPKTAHAYIDPGAGSAIFQAIIATVAILAVSIKVFWSKINIFFVNIKKKITSNK